MKKLAAVFLTMSVIFCAGCMPPRVSSVDSESVGDSVDSGTSVDYDSSLLHPDGEMEGSIKIAAPNVTSHKNALEAFIESFHVKFPKITVETTYLDMSGYKAAVVRSASSAEALNKPETMFDVFWMPQDYINEWYDLRILASLEGFIAQDEEISKNDLIEQTINDASVNGQMYMMPRDYNQVVMFYNTDMFDSAGVDYPTSGMSADDFRDMLEALREGLSVSNDKNAYGMRYRDVVQNIVDCNIKWDSLCWPLLKSFGATIVDETGTVTFDSEETYQALSYWKGLTDDVKYQCRLAIKTELGSANPGQQFRMQQAPIYFQSRAVISDVVTDVKMGGQYFGIKTLGVAGLPNFGGTYTIGGGCSGYAMYSKSVNVAAAWQFLKHVVSVEGQNAYSETGDCVPVLKSLLDDENAAWRKALPDILPSDFDHGVFIENRNAYASTRDFYQYIPLKAQRSVLARIEETFNSFSQFSQESALRGAITSSAQKMINDINQA